MVAALAGERVIDTRIDIHFDIFAARKSGFRIAELDAWFDAPEQVGRQHRIAFLGVIIGHVAHRRVDTEDLLAQRDPRSRAACGRRQVGPERAAIRCGNIDVSSFHVVTLLAFRFE